MSIGLTLDTGALIALERRDRRVKALITAALDQGGLVTVPAPVLVEWCRDASLRPTWLAALAIEPLTAHVACLAGESLGRVGAGPSVVDAVVMTSAAQRGDRVLTGDMEDLTKLQAVFASVRLLRV